MQKILIMGGTGFVGQNTAREFADNGIQVVVTTRNDGNNPVVEGLLAYSQLISVEQCDLRDLEQVTSLFKKHDFTGVVNLAASHQDATSRAQNNEIYGILFNCLDNAVASNVTRFISASSMAVYGGTLPPFNEAQEFPQVISYEGQRSTLPLPEFEVRSKRIVESIVIDYGTPMALATGSGGTSESATAPPRTLEVANLRFPMQFGPGYLRMGNPLALAVHTAAGKIDDLQSRLGYLNLPIIPLWSIMGSLIPPIYVKDSAKAIVAAMTAKSLPNKIYNVTGAYSTKAKVQLETLYQVAPTSKERIAINPEELTNQETELGTAPDLIKQDLDWEPSFTLGEAFKDYLQWLESHDF